MLNLRTRNSDMLVVQRESKVSQIEEVPIEESYTGEYLSNQGNTVSLTDILNSKTNSKTTLASQNVGRVNAANIFVAPNVGGGHRSFRDYNTGNSATSIANWVSKTNDFKILK